MDEAKISKAVDQQYEKNLESNGKSKLARKRLWMRTYIYSGGRGGRYCKFMWGRGHDIYGQCHINGGDSGTEVVQQRRQQIDEKIAQDDELMDDTCLGVKSRAEKNCSFGIQAADPVIRAKVESLR